MLAGLFVVYKFFGLASTAAPGELLERGRRHCAQRWDALQLSRGTEFHLDYYCFRYPHCSRTPFLPRHPPTDIPLSPAALVVAPPLSFSPPLFSAFSHAWLIAWHSSQCALLHCIKRSFHCAQSPRVASTPECKVGGGGVSGGEGSRAPYVARLLEAGLRVPPEQLQVGTGQEGWTLGAALLEGTRANLGTQVWALACCACERAGTLQSANAWHGLTAVGPMQGRGGWGRNCLQGSC